MASSSKAKTTFYTASSLCDALETDEDASELDGDTLFVKGIGRQGGIGVCKFVAGVPEGAGDEPAAAMHCVCGLMGPHHVGLGRGIEALQIHHLVRSWVEVMALTRSTGYTEIVHVRRHLVVGGTVRNHTVR